MLGASPGRPAVSGRAKLGTRDLRASDVLLPDQEEHADHREVSKNRFYRIKI